MRISSFIVNVSESLISNLAIISIELGMYTKKGLSLYQILFRQTFTIFCY